MAIPNNQLFLDRFIEVNVQRYADNPSLVQMFQGLTLEQITLTNFREVILEGGRLAHFYDVDLPGVFTGKNQMFYPANYAIHNVAFFESEEIVSLEELEIKTSAGIYKLFATFATVLVLNGARNEVNIRNLVKEKCLCELSDDQITVDSGLSYVNIKSPTVVGFMTVNESRFDDTFRMNGQYRMDGSVKAL